MTLVRRRQPLDPRMRLLLLAGAVAVALVLRHAALLALLATLLLVAALATPGLGGRVVARRLVSVTLFWLMLVVFLPWSVPGNPMVEVGPAQYTAEGLSRALRIGLKAVTVVLAVTVLVTPVEPLVLGQAVAQCGAPARLIQLYLFTLRYLRVLEEEYRQLRRAMTIRGFRPRCDLHTFRSFGYLIGMLLIRALDRAERIWQAMLCRGFTGKFPEGEQLRMTARDYAAGIAGACLLVLLAAVDRGMEVMG